MAAPRKRASSSDKAKGPARRATAPTSFIRVRHSEALHKRTLSVLVAIDAAANATLHRAELGAVIIELTSSGLDHCFMQPLKKSKPGFVLEQTAMLGLAGVQQMIGKVVAQVIGHMNAEQLLSVSASIRRFMR